MEDSKITKLSYLILLVLMMMLLGFARSDTNQDRAECAEQLVGLATCLPYVGGDGKGSPTIDCCSGLKQVLDKSKKCLCILIKDRDDPTLGLKINATLAATLPSACHAPVNISQCVSLLHLAPNSSDAKLFEGFAKITEGHGSLPAANGNSTSNASTAKEYFGNSTSNASTANEKSDGGKGQRWLGVEMVYGVYFVWFLTSYLIFDAI